MENKNSSFRSSVRLHTQQRVVWLTRLSILKCTIETAGTHNPRPLNKLLQYFCKSIMERHVEVSPLIFIL